MMSTVLVTNYNYKNALAAVRNIGKNNIQVHTCGPPTRNRVASFSGYSSGWAIYTSPNENMERFIADIKKIISSREYDIYYPLESIRQSHVHIIKKSCSSTRESPSRIMRYQKEPTINTGQQRLRKVWMYLFLIQQ